MSEALQRQGRGVVAAVKDAGSTVVTGLGVLWTVHVVNFVLGGWLASFAIVPRTAAGLTGILFAPFLHGSLAHLMANSVAFLLLAPLMMLRRRRDLWAVSVAGAVSSGLGAWLLGAPASLHLGASGVLFAYLGFLMARGFFERSVRAVALSVLVTWLFGGAVWGIFPVIAGAGISWQAHLFGFLGGIWAASRMRR